MLRHRVIPALLLSEGRLVKTRRFKAPKYVGDPINSIRIFNDKEVDELLVLDICASSRGRGPDFETLESLVGECFMPLCYGGGITTMDQAAKVFDLGVEKVSFQTAAMSNLNLISDVAKRFGSQSVAVSVDIKRNWRNAPKLYMSSQGRMQKTNWLDFIKSATEAGAGEIVLNAVDRDGEMTGYDLELIAEASSTVSVPVVALGGAGGLPHFKQAISAGASAVAAGAFFVFHGPHRAVLITYPAYSELEHLLGGVA
jgi:imidazole glycerol-phosphate synthase subunit HisF